MLRNRNRKQQGRILHTHLSMDLPCFFKGHCYEGAGRVHWSCAPIAAQQVHEQKAVVCPLARTSFGRQILHYPNTDTISCLRKGQDLLYMMITWKTLDKYMHSCSSSRTVILG